MVLDLRKDAVAIYKLIVKRVNAYIAQARGPVSAVCITYTFIQRGWVIVHFDSRPAHKRDGHIAYEEKEVFKRPQWLAAGEALPSSEGSEEQDDRRKKKVVTLVLPDGTTTTTATLSEESFSAILGTLLKEVLFKANSEHVFDNLPKLTTCQFDINEFNQTWAWPEYEQLGKVNLL